MCCKLNRYLSDDEHVDHIDNDKMNDSISNLQILSQKENNQKGRSKSLMTLRCPVCNNEFTKEARNLKNKLASGKEPTCSRTCGGKLSLVTAKNNAPVSALAHNQ